MNYDITKAEYVDGYRLRLFFADGRSGVVDFLPFIEKGGVFDVLRDLGAFRQFSIDPDWNTVAWRNSELDMAPETLYFEAVGEWPAREAVMKVAEDPSGYGSAASR